MTTTAQAAAGYPVGECDACKAAVVWAIAATDQKLTPVDALPASDGTIELQPRPGMPPLAAVLAPMRAWGRRDLHKPHACPAGPAWRPRGTRTPRGTKNWVAP